MPGELCILDGYNKLPPAHVLSFDLTEDHPKVWRHWDLLTLTFRLNMPMVDLLDELEFLLEDSVKRQPDGLACLLVFC